MQRSKLRIENLLQQRTVIGRALLEETKTDVEIKIRIILFSVLTLYARCANIYRLKKYRGVEQLVARRAHNPEVVGSNPSPATHAQIAQLVEQRTENPRVTGSIPVLGICNMQK